MTAKKLFSIFLAAVMLAAVFACAACGGKPGQEALEPTAEPTPEPTEAPTPEPTEAPGFDASVFNGAFADLNGFIVDPTMDTFKALYPADFFENLKAYMDDSLEENGMTYADMGYEDFDAFIQDAFSPEQIGETFSSEALGRVRNVEFKVNECEETAVENVLERFGSTLEFFDEEKLTAAYELNADVTLFGENGESETNEAQELTVYQYDGRYYILFG